MQDHPDSAYGGRHRRNPGNPAGFDSAGFLRENVPENLSIEQAADALAQKMVAPLDTVIRSLDESAPGQSLIQVGRPALSMVMIRFEDGVMKVAIRDMVYLGHSATSPQFRIESTDCPGSCTGPNMVFAAGSSDAVTRFLRSRSERFRLGDPEYALKLLHIESASEPGTVGPPFSILEGDRNGFRWIAPGACPMDEFTAAETPSAHRTR